MSPNDMTTFHISLLTVLPLLRCHTEILCLPGETPAGLISKGRVICLETCSRAQLPGALLNLLSQVAPMLECFFYLLQSTEPEKKEKLKKKKKRKTRHNRKQEQERDLADSAEARCRVWLDSPSSLWLAQAGGWLLHGSGGLFIAGRLYQTPGPSLFSCCCCLVGCRYKLDCRRCGELPGGSQPDDRSRRRSGEISATPFFFFLIARRQLVKAASGARVVQFSSVSLYILPPVLFAVFLS